MKFHMVVNYYLVSLSFNFHADRRARVVKARAHILSRLPTFMTRVRAFIHQFSEHIGYNTAPFHYVLF